MNDFWSKNKNNIITFLLGATILVGGVSIIALLGGTIMKVFGFDYNSVGSVVLFFIIATIISYPLNLIAGALPKALLTAERTSKQFAIVLYLLLDTTATFIGLRIVDYYMNSVSATDISIIVVSILLSLFSVDIDRKEKKTD